MDNKNQRPMRHRPYWIRPTREATICSLLLAIGSPLLSIAQEKLVIAELEKDWTPTPCWLDPTEHLKVCHISAFDEDGHPAKRERIFVVLRNEPGTGPCCAGIPLLNYSNVQWDGFGNAYLVTDEGGTAELELDGMTWQAPVDSAHMVETWLSVGFIWPNERPLAAWSDQAKLDEALRTALDASMIKVHLHDPCRPVPKPKARKSKQ